MTSPRGRSSPSVSERGRGACAATVVLAVALGFAAPAAWAAPPPASGTFNYDVSLTVNTFPAGHSFACGTVSIDAAPLPTVSAIGSGGCTSVLQAIFGYYVEIVGPANVLVPITVASTATLSANGLAQAGFSLGVGSQTIGIGNCYFASLTACGAHSTSTSMVMMTNQLYSVGMMADVSNFLGDGTGSAVVDPQFFFDGNFGPDYTFVFSPGVGNGVTVGVVPEPETLALMLAGLAAGSIALRRRRGIRI